MDGLAAARGVRRSEDERARQFVVSPRRRWLGESEEEWKNALFQEIEGDGGGGKEKEDEEKERQDHGFHIEISWHANSLDKLVTSRCDSLAKELEVEEKEKEKKNYWDLLQKLTERERIKKPPPTFYSFRSFRSHGHLNAEHSGSGGSAAAPPAPKWIRGTLERRRNGGQSRKWMI